MPKQQPSSVVVISGATGGIGGSVTERLWREGYNILALGKTSAKVQDMRTWFHRNARRDQVGWCLTVDVVRRHAIWRAATMLEARQCRVEALVMCHGAAPHPVEAHLAELALNYVYKVDVMGAYALCQAFGVSLRASRQGSVIFVGSAHAHATYPERVPYCVAKAAVCGLARGLAVEWGPSNVRVNTILPWQVEGARSQRFINEAAASGMNLREAYVQRSPLRKLVTPEDIAETVLWLLRTPSVTGAEIVVDSGVLSSMWYKPFLEPPVCNRL